MREVERINKSVLTADSIEGMGRWSLSQKENPVLCFYCKSPLFYIQIVWGVVEEEELFKNMGIVKRNRKPHYSLREVGLNLYCAECGHFHDDYCKYFYPKDREVCSWSDEELDLAEIEEIKYCLTQFNQKGDFIPSYKSSQMNYLKKMLKEYEEKHFGRKVKKKK
jgi:hypothetical protein|tara:strand:+ start:2988 stop:3482 length:495 start_codon:yes stop_codon:yes gene_type:complete